MPYRLEVVHMFRCEHAELYRRFNDCRAAYTGGTPVRPKTLEAAGAADLLNKRLGPGEALLAHGTNPSSAMGILKTGFSLAAAGKSTGTLFGNPYVVQDAGDHIATAKAQGCDCLIGDRE